MIINNAVVIVLFFFLISYSTLISQLELVFLVAIALVMGFFFIWFVSALM